MSSSSLFSNIKVHTDLLVIMIYKSLLLKNNGQTACLANDVGETDYIHIKQQNLIVLSSLAHKSIQSGQRSHCRPKTLQVQEERVRNML